MPVTSIQPNNAQQLQDTAKQAGIVLASGGLVVFPTETVYGIGAMAGNDQGYEALRTFKDRPEAPFTIHIPDAASAERYADLSDPMVRRFINKVFPGPVTVVVDVTEDVIDRKLEALGLTSAHRERLYHDKTVGLRCPDHPVGQAILASIDGPVVASSANLKGQAPPLDAETAAAAVGDAAELIVDGGRCRYAKASTIVRIRATPRGPSISVLREGVFDERYIRKMLRWTVLLICSGNTCRSPMAEAILRDMLSKEKGIAAEDLEAAGYRVISAGTSAMTGSPATQEAVDAMAAAGIDLSRHRSRALTRELINEADAVFTMTDAHRRAVLALAPDAARKVLPLDAAGDIQDPIGQSPAVYQQTADVIRQKLAERLKEQQP